MGKSKSRKKSNNSSEETLSSSSKASDSKTEKSFAMMHKERLDSCSEAKADNNGQTICSSSPAYDQKNPSVEEDDTNTKQKESEFEDNSGIEKQEATKLSRRQLRNKKKIEAKEAEKNKGTNKDNKSSNKNKTKSKIEENSNRSDKRPKKHKENEEVSKKNLEHRNSQEDKHGYENVKECQFEQKEFKDRSQDNWDGLPQKIGSWRNEDMNEAHFNNSASKDDYSTHSNRKTNRGTSRGRSNNYFSPNRNQYSDSKNDHQFDEFNKGLQDEKKHHVFIKVNEIEGDLFAMSKDYALAHCVAEDMAMGSGIAVQFSSQFRRHAELYEQRQKQGGLAVLDVEGRFIYYLVTKKYSNGKPTLHTLWCSLQKLKQHVEKHDVQKLAIPRIGCGLDRLEWSQVKLMIEFIFKDTNIDITVCNFQQFEDDSAPPTAKRSITKCYVKNVPYPLWDIETGTAIIYFGTEDAYVSDDIQKLDHKFRFIHQYKSDNRQLGSVIQSPVCNGQYKLYGCIVKKNAKDSFNFTSFQKCVETLKKNNRNGFDYVAFQAFKDSDNVLMSKITNMLRLYLHHVEIYVCWGGEMQQYMPQDFKKDNDFSKP